MATDDISTTAIALAKRPISQKNRIHSHSQSAGKPRTEEFRINRSLSKLPNLLSKTSIYPSTSESIRFKRIHSEQRDPNTSSSSSKLERSTTTINPETRLPTLYSLTSDYDQKRISEFRRRQIYALNHFMRDLEQEQFRQFCAINHVNTDKHENTGDNHNNEDTKKDIII